MRPGVNVTTRDNAPPSTIPTDVGTGFMVGVTESGPSIPTVSDLVQNMDEYKAKFAPSGRSYLPGITMYDSVETFFNEGGNRLYVGRVTGPAATKASITINDVAAAPCLIVTARGVGEWANNIDVVIRGNTQDPAIPVGSFRVRLVNETTSEVLDESYDLTDVTDAIQWAFSNQYVTAAGSTSSNDPAPGTFDLVGGSNDTVGITNTEWAAAFANLSFTLGPGLLGAPGASTSAIHDLAAESARRDLRVSILDGPDTPTASTLISAAKAVSDSERAHSRYSGLFVPWLYVSGSSTSAIRKVPPSAAVMGRFARNMANGLSANEPAAGDLGVLRTVLDLTQTYTDADRAQMNLNGVNVIKDVYGIRKVYGWRTTADPVNDPRWLLLSNSIMHRQIVAEAGAVGERYIFRQIDGQGRLVGQFAGALIGEVCMPLFMEGSLYGDSPEDAFKVDVGPSVNTEATIANNELRAVISARFAPFGEEVNVEIVKYLVTEEIAA